MCEDFLIREMLKCDEEIEQLRERIRRLKDRRVYLQALYYQLGEVDDDPSAGEKELKERIRTDGYIIGIKF